MSRKERVHHTLLTAASIVVIMAAIMIALPVKLQSWRVVSGRLSGFAVGGIAVHSSLLNAVLHEQPEIKT
jgi:hypothetical protein